MRVLVAGLGSIGRRHVRNLRALGVEDLVLYRTGRSTLSLEEFEGLPQESNLEAALAHRPDAALVCNPSSLHLSVAIPAAESGAHVFVEKPLATTLEGLPLLQAALVGSETRLQVGFQYRFHPGLLTVRQLLSEERIGRPIYARAEYAEYLPDWHPWEDYRDSYAAREELGGGVMHTLSHPFDYLRWLFGEVESVSAEIWRSGALELGVEDGAEVYLRFHNQLQASVHLNYNRRPPSQRLEVTGTSGLLRWDFFEREVACWSADGQSWTRYPDPPDFERNFMFLEEMRHFLNVVEGNGEPPCSLDDGVKALEICLAAYESAESGRRVTLTGELAKES